ncbi:MAG: flavodoxin domain-containing protein [Anaerolineales bacterium]|nr:flavodoxin domain-containing protein [Anaerolineales bacterium]
MKAAIIYVSSTGTTARAAKAMGEILETQGHQVQVQSAVDADPGEVASADLICIGSWVQGWFVVRQHPTATSMQFIDRLGDLSGKQAVVFCTYKLAAGSTLRQMGEPLEAKGAEIVGRFKFRGPDPDGEFAGFAASLG